MSPEWTFLHLYPKISYCGGPGSDYPEQTLAQTVQEGPAYLTVFL